MGGNGIDAAIAAAETPAPEARATVQVKLHTGRAVVINAPVDLDPIEVLGLVGYVATGLPAKLAEARRPGPQLLVPTGVRIARG
jgi:hypothetical protein